MSAKSQDLIQKLLKAEDDAEKIISAAREQRSRKLKDVRAAAEAELVPFKNKEEEKLKQEVAESQASGMSANELERATQQELSMVKQDYETNKKTAIKYILDKVLDIDLTLPENTKAALAMGA
jgi:V-type H+-transporting ATPase subunit G